MKPRIAFWGTSDNATLTLERLATSGAFDVVAVVTKPDAPSGRHRELAAPPLKEAAGRLGIKVLQPLKLRSPEFRAELAALDLDLSIVVAYGRIIPADVLSIPGSGTLNLHPSLLPKYRGPTPVQAAILAGDAETGITLMELDAEMDHGPILAQERIALDGTERHRELENRLFLLGADLAAAVVPKFLAGTLVPEEQDHAKATFCKMIDRDSGRIAFASTDATAAERMARAYEPWPGIWGLWKSGSHEVRYKFFDVAASPSPLPPGTIAFADDLSNLRIGTASGSLVVRGIQPEGKRRMTVADFLRGAKTEFLLGRFE